MIKAEQPATDQPIKQITGDTDRNPTDQDRDQPRLEHKLRQSVESDLKHSKLIVTVLGSGYRLKPK